MIAVVLKAIKLNEEGTTRVVKPGAVVVVDERTPVKDLMERGYLREQSEDEAMEQLREFAAEAKRILAPYVLDPSRPCPVCHTSNWGLSLSGSAVCGTCHPHLKTKNRYGNRSKYYKNRR